MAKIELSQEEKLMAAIFGIFKGAQVGLPLCYPHVVIVEADGGERTFTLAEATEEALESLPLSKGQRDSQKWGRMKKVLELRFGLRKGKSGTLDEVGREMGGISRETVRKMEAKALRLLRHPSRSKRLKMFLIPSPEEVAGEKKRLEALTERCEKLERELRQSEERCLRLRKILRRYGAQEEDFGEIEVEDLTESVQTTREGLEALKTLLSPHLSPLNKRVWNMVRRGRGIDQPITSITQLKKLVESGGIRQVAGIGQKAEEFLRQVLQIAEQKASP